jgi:hypothetical protein
VEKESLSSIVDRTDKGDVRLTWSKGAIKYPSKIKNNKSLFKGEIF